MARVARKISPINCYTIIIRMDDGLLLDKNDHNMFLNILKKYEYMEYKVLAFAMDRDIINVVFSNMTNLECTMRKITVSFVGAYNKAHSHKGGILKDRFTSIGATTYDQLWDMVFDVNNMTTMTNSDSDYDNDVIARDMILSRFGSFEEMHEMARARLSTTPDRLVSTYSCRIKDEDLEKFISSKYGIEAKELINIPKRDLNYILHDIFFYTKASVRQMGRISKLSLKYLWEYVKKLKKGKSSEEYHG